MKIKRIISQHRRDFRADYECQHCGFVDFDKKGYDDSYFHNEVIPAMKCSECGETSITLGVDYRPLTTKYPDGFQI